MITVTETRNYSKSQINSQSCRAHLQPTASMLTFMPIDTNPICPHCDCILLRLSYTITVFDSTISSGSTLKISTTNRVKNVPLTSPLKLSASLNLHPVWRWLSTLLPMSLLLSCIPIRSPLSLLHSRVNKPSLSKLSPLLNSFTPGNILGNLHCFRALNWL